jgi:hypothetical protein
MSVAVVIRSTAMNANRPPGIARSQWSRVLWVTLARTLIPIARRRVASGPLSLFELATRLRSFICGCDEVALITLPATRSWPMSTRRYSRDG